VALTLSRIDKRQRTYTVADNLGGTYTTIDVALLPVRSSPTAATVWTSVPYAAGVATVVWAGPDADSSGAIVVTADADMWIKGTNAPYVQAVKDERITVLGGGNPLVALPSPVVASVAGLTGALTAASLVSALESPLRAVYGRAAPVLAAFVYDGSGNLTSYTEDGISIVLTYNADGTVATSKRGTEATQTYSYTSGNLVGVA
jgi:hypothetical protein